MQTTTYPPQGPEIDTLYVRIFDAGEWLDTWAPLGVTKEWEREDGRVALFTILPNEIVEDDEYEHWREGTQVLGYRWVVDGEEDWRSHPPEPRRPTAHAAHGPADG